MEDDVQIGVQSIPSNKRLAYRIVDNMPKWVRIIYYILLIITLVYVIYRLGRAFLIGLQKVGYFCFNPQHYWVFMTCVFILLLGTLIISQFFLGLNPLGKFGNWIKELFLSIRRGLGNTIGGF